LDTCKHVNETWKPKIIEQSPIATFGSATVKPLLQKEILPNTKKFT